MVHIVSESFLNRSLLEWTDSDFSLLLEALEEGAFTVAYRNNDGEWQGRKIIQEAILAFFKRSSCKSIEGYPFSFDKIPLQKLHSTVRAVPGSIVRRGAHIGKGAILMPSFVNIGAFVGEGTMIDTWSTVGSCAHVGAYCHLSGGVGIGGVLEPLGSRPTIIEDHCFIGARSEIAEGVIVGHHSVLSAGVFLTQSTRIYDRLNQTISFGVIPPYSVVVPGTVKVDEHHSVAAAIIVKRRDEKTDAKVALNHALRDF